MEKLKLGNEENIDQKSDKDSLAEKFGTALENTKRRLEKNFIKVFLITLGSGVFVGEGIKFIETKDERDLLNKSKEFFQQSEIKAKEAYTGLRDKTLTLDEAEKLSKESFGLEDSAFKYFDEAQAKNPELIGKFRESMK